MNEPSNSARTSGLPSGRDRSEVEIQARDSRDPVELRRLYHEAENDFYARRTIASHTFADATLLDEIADDPNPIVVLRAVENLNIASTTIDRVLGIRGTLQDPRIRHSSRWTEVLIAAAWSAALDPAARRHLGRHPNPAVREIIARRPDLSDQELEDLARDDDLDVAAAATYALSCDPERMPGLLRALASDDDLEIRRAATGTSPEPLDQEAAKRWRLVNGFVIRRPRPASPKPLVPHSQRLSERSELTQLMYRTRGTSQLTVLAEQAFDQRDIDALRLCARHRRTDRSILDRLIDVPDIQILADVARNPRTPREALDRLFGSETTGTPPLRLRILLAGVLDDPDGVATVRIGWRQVEIAAARHPNLSPQLRRHLGQEHLDHDSRVLRELAARVDLSDAELITFGRHKAAGVRIRVAEALTQDPVRFPWLLDELRDDPHPHVRGTAHGKSRAEILLELGPDAIATTAELPAELQTVEPVPTDEGPDFS